MSFHDGVCYATKGTSCTTHNTTFPLEPLEVAQPFGGFRTPQKKTLSKKSALSVDGRVPVQQELLREEK
jgi:hypothetical protein